MSETSYLDARSGDHPFGHDGSRERPDIFLITVDMIPPESHLPVAAICEHLRTPNIDRLMSDGTRFVNAFSASPLCGPSRACYLTGRYPYLTVNDERAHDGFATQLRASDAIFPEYLKATGYLTKHVGKCHVGPAKFLDAFGENDTPWDRWAPPMEDDDGYLRYLRELGVEPPVWREPIRGLRPDGKTPGNSYGGWVTQPDGSELPEEATYSQYLAWLAEEKVEAALRQSQGGDRPLYLQLDFFAPHQPFIVPTSYRERFEEVRQFCVLPDSYFEAMSGTPDWPRVYQFYKLNWGLYNEDTARDYMAMNFVQIEALDAAIGRFLNVLDDKGLYDDALIIFAGDHGEMNAERGLVDKGVYGHPKTARVPLSVKPPGNQRSGQTVESLVSLVDIAPTVFDASGIQPVERLDGESLLPFVRGEKVQRDRPFIFECGWHVCPNPAVSTFAELPEGRFMYTYNLTSDADELYDLDDGSHRSLAADDGFADVKAEMIRRLAAILEDDPRWVCYWHTFRLDKYAYLEVGEGDFQMFRPAH